MARARIRSAATVNLALVFWPLGEVERARQLTELAKTHAVESGRTLNLGVHAYVALRLFEVLRGDAAENLRRCHEPSRKLAAERFTRNLRALRKYSRVGRRARQNDRAGGLEEIRQGLAAYTEHKILFTLPVAQGCLSEVEAEAAECDARLGADRRSAGGG